MIEPGKGEKKSFTIFRIASLFLGTLLILGAARGELWFDELWSVKRATDGGSFFRALFSPHDNNHILNTLYLWLLGEDKGPLLYRLLSILSGLGSLLLLDRLAERHGPKERVFVLLLATTSYPLILYFSEARGYGPAMFFSLLALYAHYRWEERPTVGRAMLFALPVALGMLAHATFLMIYLAILLYSGAVMLSCADETAAKLKRFATLHFAPLLACVAYYAFFVSRMDVGGGVPGTPSQAVPEFLLMVFGLPDVAWARVLVFFPYTLVVGWSLLSFRAKKNPEWLLFVFALLAAPAAMLLLARGDYVYWRYFVLCAPFFLFLLALALAQVWKREKLAFKAAATLLLVLITAGQAYRLYPLLRYGRNDYRGALLKISELTKQKFATITSSNDLHNELMVGYNARRLGLAGKIRYVPFYATSLEPAEFFLKKTTGDTDDDKEKDGLAYVTYNGYFKFIGEYKYCGGISGWGLKLYQKM